MSNSDEPSTPRSALLWFGDDYRQIKSNLHSRFALKRAAAVQKAMQEADALEAKGRFPIHRSDMRDAAIRPIEEAFFEQWAAERQKAEAREEAREIGRASCRERV